ncbi:hypothetical protein JAAARDRAFT_120686 [Jaapia argillacea MUCL 33604]|uniref:RNase III domain-containing protein n=1 Tax=Jaapia argillacea MUCL 33604 TaxID=933084 RepID=A0A067QJ09_9AGAM|nr:hypothetical protein JAAARDRAFT_120686 [Jaapia argillacea MUCL 33604]
MIQKSVLAAISAPTFILTFPHLEQATWSKILSKSKENLELNEQLEFLGDAVMYACVAAGLLAQIPQASPGVLTVLRGPLTTNATFAHLIDKLDLPSVAEGSSLPMSDFFRRPSSKSPFKSKTEVKRAADAFEVVCGAIYLQDGYLPLCNWVLDTFRPLISAAYRSYNHWSASVARPFTKF